MRQEHMITNETIVLRAAQSVWAMNKYLVLACSQRDYKEIRQFLRENDRDLTAAYNILKTIDTTYADITTEELPEVSNALYHIAGYFKELISNEKRQIINYLIETDPKQSLDLLDDIRQRFAVPYLLQSRFWTNDRFRKFNLVPIAVVDDNVTYAANELTWHGDHLMPITSKSQNDGIIE